MRSALITMASLLCILATAARADWHVNIEPPDVFGKKNVMAADLNGIVDREIFIVKCYGDTLTIAYIRKKKEFKEIDERAADLFIQIDNGNPIKIPARILEWNSKYEGIEYDFRLSEVYDISKAVAILTSIADSKSPINLGATAGEEEIMTASVGAGGSGAAMATVIKECHLTGNAKPTQQD